MFVVEVGAVLTTAQLVWNLAHHLSGFAFELQITLWLWFTVLFANFAEAMAEGRGKAQADTLRRARAETMARRLRPDGSTDTLPGSKLRTGDVVLVKASEFIPGDGEVIEGVASVDESAITGESAPVIREAGGDRSAVTGGTRVLSDEIKIRITSNPGETFLDRMIKLVEGAARQKTPNEIALNILLAGLTIIFLLAVVTLQPMAIYSGAPQSLFVLVSLLVCLIPTTIGGLLSAIGIAGMDRVVQRNVLAMSGRAVEAAGDVDTLLLDKTGTITLGNRQATELLPAPGVSAQYLIARAARMARRVDAELYAVYVDMGQDTDEQDQKTRDANLQFAESLGATVVRLKGDDVARATAAFVLEKHITQVIFGRSAVEGWRKFLYMTAINRFLRNAPAVDVHIVTQEPD